MNESLRNLIQYPITSIILNDYFTITISIALLPMITCYFNYPLTIKLNNQIITILITNLTDSPD